MELHKKCEIKIFRIESPQKFWFRTLRNEMKIQKSLDLYFRENNPKKNYKPLINEVIIIKVVNKYSIVCVEKMTNDNIVVSFIETGKTKIINNADVIELKDQEIVNGAKNTVLIGAIDGILPATVVKITFLELNIVILLDKNYTFC